MKKISLISILFLIVLFCFSSLPAKAQAKSSEKSNIVVTATVDESLSYLTDSFNQTMVLTNLPKGFQIVSQNGNIKENYPACRTIKLENQSTLVANL